MNMQLPQKIEALIITLSDRAFRGEYEDRSGPRVKELLSAFFRENMLDFNIDQKLIADEEAILRNILLEGGRKYNIIITTGGTGIGPRDITVETVKPMLSKEIPGVMEFIRVKYGSTKPNALLSGGVAGILGNAIIYTIPGSLKAADEYMREITRTLYHTMEMQHGIDTHSDGR